MCAIYVYVWFKKIIYKSVRWIFYILCNLDEGGDSSCQENIIIVIIIIIIIIITICNIDNIWKMTL